MFIQKVILFFSSYEELDSLLVTKDVFTLLAYLFIFLLTFVLSLLNIVLTGLFEVCC